ncbi:MAG: carbohydrate kinase family protein [Lachnospiraceae bacterium]
MEDDGERTFACYHGAEYRFQKEWFDALDASEIDSVYICGLEIEEETGTNILSYLEEHPEFTVFLLRVRESTLLDPKAGGTGFALHPILHLNQQEITSYTGKEELKAAAEEIHRFTQNTVIVTLGADGCYYYDGEKEETIPGVPAEQLDTIGAGDSAYRCGDCRTSVWQDYSRGHCHSKPGICEGGRDGRSTPFG